MNSRNALQPVIGLVTVMFLLVGCGPQETVPTATSLAEAPVAASTLIPPASTSTPVPPTPTSRPIPSTSTPTPIPPTPMSQDTPTPDRGIMAVVTMTDGDVYEIYTVSFVEAFCKGAGIYSLGADHPVAYLPLLVGPVALEIPFDQVERMDLNLDATVQVDQGVAQGTTVTLVNGQELQGFLVYLTYGGESRPARAIYGRTAITGGSEDFESEISKIASVTFMVAGEGKVSATVSETNGTVTEGVSNFGFIIEAGTNRTGVDKLQNVAIRVGDITSEVPVTDI
jgi:hypothetical protein